MLTDDHKKTAIALTHSEMSTNHDRAELNPKWVRLRNKFLDKYPDAKKLFAQDGEKRDYQFRIKNVQIGANAVAPDTGKISQVLREVVQILRVDLSIASYDIFKQLATVVNSQHFNIRNVKDVIDNYKTGIVIVPKIVNGVVKSQRVSIGAVLSNSNQVLKVFLHDPFRVNNSKSFDIVVTGHPIDVYGVSTGRHWTSCMDLDNSANKRENLKHINSDIQNHTHVVYLVPSGGDVDTQAIARVTFKKHHSITGDKDALLSDNKVYGDAPSKFLEVANKIMGDIFKVEDGVYVLPPSAYAECNPIREVGESKTLFSASGWKKLTDDFAQLHEEDQENLVDRLSEALNQMNQHDVGMVMNSIESGSDFFGDTIANLEPYHNHHDAIDAIFDMQKFSELARDYYDLEKEIFSKLKNDNVVRWFVKTHYFKDAIGDILRGIFENIQISHDTSNMDTELAELDAKCLELSISKLTITHADFGEHGDLVASYVAAHFKNLYDAFSTHSIKKDDHVGAIGASVINELFLDTIKDFEEHHEGAQPERVDRIFDGVAHRYNTQHGEAKTTIELLFQTIHATGYKKVSNIEGYEYFKQWIKQYLVDKFPSSLELTGDKLSVRQNKTDQFDEKLDSLTGQNQHIKEKVLDLLSSQ